MIKIENISKSFGDKQVLKNISAEFEQGKTNLIIGQSGSGQDYHDAHLHRTARA